MWNSYGNIAKYSLTTFAYGSTFYLFYDPFLQRIISPRVQIIHPSSEEMLKIFTKVWNTC